MTKFVVRWPSGRAVAFRSLSWAEFQRYERELQYRGPMEVYCDLYRTVVFEGPGERDVTAGIVEFVGRLLMDHNPFNGKYEDVARALELKRIELQNNYLLSVKAVIASLFQVSVEEINTWDAEKFFEYAVMAEFVSGRKLEPGDPNRKPSKPSKTTPTPLTERQQMTLNRVQTRDQQGSGPVEGPGEAEPAPRLRRPLTPAQQLVLDRVNNARTPQR